jgi:hypothetical protein
MINQPKRLKTPNHTASIKQERGAAKRYGGKVVKGSGAGFTKGDVRIHGVARIEAKTTIHKSFSVTAEIISKIENAAVPAGEVPIIEVELGSGHKVCLIPTWAVEVLLEKASR